MKTILRGYEFRLYPNSEQKRLINQTFGCCRFVFNNLLAQRINYYKENKKSLSNNYSCLLNDYDFLKDVPSQALSQITQDLNIAYKNFFRNPGVIGFPKFKSKHNHNQSYRDCMPSKSMIIDNNHIKLAKLGIIRCKVHRPLPNDCRIKNYTVKQKPSGKYFVIILVEEVYFEEPSTGCCVGFDLGVKDLIITSEGQKFDNVKLTAKYANQLAFQQRRLAKMVNGSNNYEKQRIKVAKVYEKITNKRKDYLHKISHKLIIENQVIVSEKLKVSNMVKNHKLAKLIEDCSWSQLCSFVSYKSEWNDRNYVQIDTFYPSSKTCSNCSYKLEELSLNIREWNCPSCGQHHDRDINAAINILNEGLRILNS